MAKKVTKQVLNIAKYKSAEASKTIVDLNQFKGSIFDTLLSKYRTFMALNKIQGSNRDFKRTEMVQSVKEIYNQMMEVYPKKDTKEMIPFVSTPLLETYKLMTKANKLPWDLEPGCVSTSISQARVFNDKTTTTYSARVWYQITLEHTLNDGSKKYHIVEKKISEPFWRYCYFDQ